MPSAYFDLCKMEQKKLPLITERANAAAIPCTHIKYTYLNKPTQIEFFRGENKFGIDGKAKRLSLSLCIELG